jgi:hypothetical protein
MANEKAVAAPEEGQVAPDSTEQPAPYFEFTPPGGKPEVYATKDELAKAYKDSFMRTSDYTRKTQEVAKQRQEHEQRTKDFEEQQKLFAKSKSQYDEWDRMLKARPQVARQLMQLGQAPAAPGEVFQRAQGYVDEKYKALEDKLTALEKEREAERFNRELEGSIQNLSGEFKDFDRDAVLALLNEVSNGDTSTLLKHLYFSHKGQKSPVEAEKKVLEGIEKKRQAGIVPSSKATPPSNGKAPKSIKEARAMLLAEAGGG